jgi:uncharacterized protein (DUF58 family)
MLSKFKKLFSTETEKVKINFFGKLYIGFTLFIGFAAINTGNNMLYLLLSFLLSLMGISGFLSRYNFRSLEISFIPPEDVWCCKENTFKVHIENRKKFPSFLLKVIFGNFSTQVVPVVRKHGEVEIKLVPQKRGILKISSVSVESDFPFGLFTRLRKIPVGEEIVVFPKPREVKFLISERGRGKEKVSAKATAGKKGGTILEGIKQYSGESFFKIYWKALAKYGELMAKEFASETQTRTLEIDLENLPGRNLEEKISQATFLILKARKNGYAVGLKFKNHYIPPSVGLKHYRELLKFLALL